MSGFIRRRRRERLLQRPFPEAWRDVIVHEVPYYALLSLEEQRTLEGHIQVFLAEKRFEGVDDFKITDEVRLVIAAEACLLLLHIDVDYFPKLRSIIVYHDSFVVSHSRRDRTGLVTESSEVLVGESWELGAVILSWREIERDTRVIGARNVVFHEFAHQIDQSDGAADGWPDHLDRAMEQRWGEVMRREYAALVAATRLCRPTFIDPYGATKPAEFFAVVTEVFFGQPRQLKTQHRDLYEMFRLFYHQDPAVRFPAYSLWSNLGLPGVESTEQ